MTNAHKIGADAEQLAALRWTFTLPGRIATLNRTLAMHPMARYRLRKRLKRETFALLNAARVPPLGRARLGITYHVCGKAPDYDNLVGGAMKYVIDAIRETGVLLDDDSGHLAAEYRSESCKRGQDRVEVEIREWD